MSNPAAGLEGAGGEERREALPDSAQMSTYGVRCGGQERAQRESAGGLGPGDLT